MHNDLRNLITIVHDINNSDEKTRLAAVKALGNRDITNTRSRDALLFALKGTGDLVIKDEHGNEENLGAHGFDEVRFAAVELLASHGIDDEATIRGLVNSVCGDSHGAGKTQFMGGRCFNHSICYCYYY